MSVQFRYATPVAVLGGLLFLAAIAYSAITAKPTSSQLLINPPTSSYFS